MGIPNLLGNSKIILQKKRARELYIEDAVITVIDNDADAEGEKRASGTLQVLAKAHSQGHRDIRARYEQNAQNAPVNKVASQKQPKTGYEEARTQQQDSKGADTARECAPRDREQTRPWA